MPRHVALSQGKEGTRLRKDRLDEATIIGIVKGIQAATTDPGKHGFMFIRAMTADSIKSCADSELDAPELAKQMLRICYGGDIQKLTMALRQHWLESGPWLPENKAIDAAWATVFQWIEKTPHDALNHRMFVYACYTWAYFNCADPENIGRYTSLLRRLIGQTKQVPPASVDAFLTELVKQHAEWGSPQVVGIRHHCYNALIEHVANAGTVWGAIKEAFIGKIKGFDAWVKAVELRAQLIFLGQMYMDVEMGIGSDVGVRKRNELYEQLEECFNDPRDAKAWLEQYKPETEIEQKAE